MTALSTKTREVEIPSSSMADIAFLLLVFFLVCTTIDSEKGLQLQLPGMEEQEVAPKNLVRVLLNSEGLILFNGKAVSRNGLAEAARAALQDNPLVLFSLQAARKTTYRDYILVLDGLKTAGANRISLAEPEEE